MKSEVSVFSHDPVDDEERTGYTAKDARPFTSRASPSTDIFRRRRDGRTHPEFDWSRTPLDPLSNGRTVCDLRSIMLASRQPVWIGWGSELITSITIPIKPLSEDAIPRRLANRARSLAGNLGSVAPVLQRAMAGNRRNLCRGAIAHHATARVSRRNVLHVFLHSHSAMKPALAASFAPTPTIPQRSSAGGESHSCRNWRPSARANVRRCLRPRVQSALATNSKDLPFVLIYLPDSSGQMLALKCAVGISTDHRAAPASMP